MINLDASKFAEKIAETDVVVLDVRTPAEFNSGHITNAINIDIYNDYFISILAFYIFKIFNAISKPSTSVLSSLKYEVLTAINSPN